jgi:hypothetical protein
MSFTNLEQNHNGFVIYGEARGHSELARQIYDERFSQRILPMDDLYKRCATSWGCRAFRNE